MDASQGDAALQTRIESVGGALGDPLRVRILARLLAGAASVSDLVAAVGASQPNVSNHLAVLRAAGLVVARRHGRQAHYELATPAVAHLVEALVNVTGDSPARSASPALAAARSCYDHLAGRLGVAVLDALVAAGAIAPPDRDETRRQGGHLEIGADGAAVFATLGVDLASLPRSRRPRALACLDWTESRPHLGGALGRATLDAFAAAGWVQRIPGSRVLEVTPVGQTELEARLGIAARVSAAS